jgi:PKHD-type hydroxylase
MIYKIPPHSNPNEGLPFVIWPDAFSEDEVNKIIEIGEEQILDNANVVDSIDKSREDSNVRKSKVSWIHLNSKSSWLYDKATAYARRVNGEYYRFDMDGLYESMQFTVYEDKEKDFYHWHQDIGVYSTVSVTRKISMSLLLSNPDDYEGGDLEIWGSTGIVQAPKVKGMPVFFPSYLLHRVTPVTKGTRKSLVVWYGGPAFK